MVYNRGAGCVNIRLLAYRISYKKYDIKEGQL